MDSEVKQLLEESGRWPGLRLDGESAYLDRVNQFREFGWSQRYEEVDRVDEHVAECGETPVRVKVYVGAGVAGTTAPALLRLHGGGMALGSPEIEDRGSRALANALGCRVFSPAYRLAPEWPHPAAVEDCRTALRWLVSQAKELAVERERITMLGHSAGGMLAVGSCLAIGDKALPARIVVVEPMLGPQMATDSMRRFATGYGLSRELVERFWRLYLPIGTETDPGDCPWLADPDLLGGLPPVHVFTSELDPLRDDGKQLAERLRHAGVEVSHRQSAGLVHGSIYYCGRVAAAKRVFDAVVDVARGDRA